MTGALSTAAVPLVAAWTGVGLLLGLVYFAALWRTVASLAGGSSWVGPIALTIGRIGGAALLLAAAARLGAPDLLAALGGFAAARMIAVRVERGAG